MCAVAPERIVRKMGLARGEVNQWLPRSSVLSCSIAVLNSRENVGARPLFRGVVGAHVQRHCALGHDRDGFLQLRRINDLVQKSRRHCLVRREDISENDSPGELSGSEALTTDLYSSTAASSSQWRLRLP